MARGLGIPLGDPAAAVAVLLDALRRAPRVVDAATVTTPDGIRTRFAGVLSAGFDAIVNERANRMRWPRGRSRYNLALLLELAVLNPIRYRLVLDDVETVTDALLVAVANNTSFGGGMLITPDARLDDGLLDVFVVQPMSRIAFLRIFPRVFKGTHVTDPRVSIRRAQPHPHRGGGSCGLRGRRAGVGVAGRGRGRSRRVARVRTAAEAAPFGEPRRGVAYSMSCPLTAPSYSGLVRRPLTAVTPVRIRLGSQQPGYQ